MNDQYQQDEEDQDMKKLNGAEAMVRMLEAHGVKHIFGLCGDTSLPFYDALYGMDHGMTHVLTRDERSAAYMADGYARIARRPGVCEGPSGGGATYILPGVVEANESSVPVLAITTDIASTARGRYTLTELDQRALFRPLTKWNGVLDRADRVPETMRAAFRAMTMEHRSEPLGQHLLTHQVDRLGEGIGPRLHAVDQKFPFRHRIRYHDLG